MKNNDSSVSVIIPVFNGEMYLREAIDSVLGQTYRPTEIIVVDDGSTDGSSMVAKSFGSDVKCSSQSNLGPSAALNRGVELSVGNFLSFLDADDIWTKDKLLHQMTAFKDHPDADMVFGQVRQFYSPELNENQRKQFRIPVEVTRGISKGSMLIRRTSFLRVGHFGTQWRVGDFIDWYLRAIEIGLKSLHLNDLVLLRRIHASNMGIRERKSQAVFARILKDSLDRRRRPPTGGTSS